MPNDGGRYGLLTPRMWSQSMTVEEFSAADFVGADKLDYLLAEYPCNSPMHR